MTERDDAPVSQTPDISATEPQPAPLSRRRFLGGVGTVAAAALAGVAPAQARPGADLDQAVEEGRRHGQVDPRRQEMYDLRVKAAQYHRDLPAIPHPVNGDENRYESRIGNYSKGLPHDAFGEVDPDAYDSLLKAMRSTNPDDYEAIQSSGGRRLVNPQAGLAFDLEGYDAQYMAPPAAPALASAEAAGEMVELYWMALLRDVPLEDYDTDPDVAEACADLNKLSVFKGARQHGVVTPASLFRDPLTGCLKGAYISQFLWMDTPFGSESVDRRIHLRLPGSDYLTDYDEWLQSQNGFSPTFANHDPIRRYIQKTRDLTEWAHNDVLFQAYMDAALILGVPKDPFDQSGSGLTAPSNPGNPYRKSKNQIGFATFGDPYRKTVMCEVATRALKATWYQKWQVHRRLRPEAYAGLVHHQITSNRYPNVLHPDVLNSKAVERIFSKFGTYLLPQAFPEGCPLHPSYTAGHATVAGACVTVLKALYDESYVIPIPVLPNADGLTLSNNAYQGPDLTVGGELNKLASNIATGRNHGGVHWRSDARESLKLGEAIAISILRDQKAFYSERFDGYTFTAFDGTRVTV
jgi:hypothetical protein